MKRIQSIFLFLSVLVLLTGCTGKKVYYVSPDGNDLVALLEETGLRMIRAASQTEALASAPKGGVVMLLGERFSLSEVDMETVGQKGLHLYAEYATLPGQEAATKTIGVERVVVTEQTGGLAPMDLLSINRSEYLDVQADHPLMVIARVAGFNTAVYGLENTPYAPLVYQPAENVFIATAVLSNFYKIRFMPEKNWQLFWEAMMSKLLEKTITFKQWPTQVKPAYVREETLPQDARKKAVEKGVEWFFNGHFLVHPSWKGDWLDRYQGSNANHMGPELSVDLPDGDGSLGILEGHCSAILADGRQTYRYCMRADVQGETSMAFALAGKLLGNERYMQISANLMDYCFRVFRDGPRNDPASPTYGLLSWTIDAHNSYYGDDNARCLLGIIMGAALSGEDRWDQLIREGIDANFLTTGKNGFRTDRLEDGDIQANGLDYYQQREIINPHPHFESWLWACYLWLYAKTGEQKYYDLAERGIRLTMRAYPDNWGWTNGIQQERARMVLPLAWLYRVSPTEEHLQWLKTMTNEIARNQEPCGAIREELGDPSKGYFGTQKSNAEYGVTEAPLIFQNGDPVADMLYTSNFAIFGLNEAATATGDEKIRKMADALAEFLIRIQARSDSYKNIDGAWYRAFNYGNWDYWASNADAGWGNLGTLTGWTQSWIVSTLALMEMGTSFWDVTTK